MVGGRGSILSGGARGGDAERGGMLGLEGWRMETWCCGFLEIQGGEILD